MSKFKENALESVLYYLHRQGHTPQYAHAQLRNMTWEETMSLEEVVDFFGKITHGTYGIKEIDEESKLHLTQQVDEVYNKIVENLDFTSRLSLLTTCKKLRHVSRTRELYIKTLTLNFSTNYFRILTDDGYEKTFLLASHCENTNNYENWEDGHYLLMDKIEDELQKVFQFGSTRIDSFNLTMEENQAKGHEFKMIDEITDHISSNLPHNIEVKSLTSNCPLAPVWRWTVGNLEGIKHVKFVKEKEEGNHFIMDIDEKKSIEKFTSVQYVRAIRNLAHVSYCKVIVKDAPTVNVLMTLKEKLLLNPKLQQFKIRSKPSSKIYIKLNEHFKTYVMPGAKIPINQIFNYPGSRTDKLSFYATDQLFWFKGPCYADNGEPDEEPEGVDDGFGWVGNYELDEEDDESEEDEEEYESDF